MPGAPLFFLHDELDAGIGDRLPDSLRFVTDDGIYILRRNNVCRRGDNMGQKRFPADLMQNFRMLGFEARPLARSHYRDGDARGVAPGFCF